MDALEFVLELGADGLPRGWIRRMKRSITTLVPVFNTNRMVEEYAERCYLPSHRRFTKLAGGHLKAAQELAEWRRRVRHERRADARRHPGGCCGS